LDLLPVRLIKDLNYSMFNVFYLTSKTPASITKNVEIIKGTLSLIRICFFILKLLYKRNRMTAIIFYILSNDFGENIVNCLEK